jgi:hypothetical protein
MATKRVSPHRPSGQCESWLVNSWPDTDFPNGPVAGKNLVRQHRAELVKAGALVRVGRTLVILGTPYRAWLAQHTGRVFDYVIPPNRPEHASNRFGRQRA